MRYLNTSWDASCAGFKDLLSEVLKLDRLFFSPVFSLRFGLLCKLGCMFSMTFFSFPFLFLCFPFHNMFFWFLAFVRILPHTAFCNPHNCLPTWHLGWLFVCWLVGWLVRWVSEWVGGWGENKSNDTSTTSSKRLRFLSCWNRFEQMKSWQNFC